MSNDYTTMIHDAKDCYIGEMSTHLTDNNNIEAMNTDEVLDYAMEDAAFDYTPIEYNVPLPKVPYRKYEQYIHVSYVRPYHHLANLSE